MNFKETVISMETVQWIFISHVLPITSLPSFISFFLTEITRKHYKKYYMATIQVIILQNYFIKHTMENITVVFWKHIFPVT
jgi:predicted Co/Zn/Cd cation transporter (cation efflux family)